MRWFALLGVAAGIACGGGSEPVGTAPPESASDVLRVYTVSYPLQYFAERIGSEHVEVHFPGPSEGDPAFWKPDVGTITEYQSADLILLNGASYAKWVETATLPTSKLVDTSASFRDQYIVIENAITHSHGPEGEHSHGETAFTTWLDPRLAIEQAAAIRDAFVAARPARESAFHQGFSSLERDLAALDERIEKAITGGADVLAVASHPVYQYLARRYGLRLPSVHFEPGEAPDADGWHDLEHVLDDHRATWMIWESEPLPATRERLAEMGLRSAVLDPCATRPGSGDYLSVMQDNAAAIEEIFSGP